MFGASHPEDNQDHFGVRCDPPTNDLTINILMGQIWNCLPDGVLQHEYNSDFDELDDLWVSDKAYRGKSRVPWSTVEGIVKEWGLQVMAMTNCDPVRGIWFENMYTMCVDVDEKGTCVPGIN